MVKVNEVRNDWIDEEEVEMENMENRKLRIIHRKINEVINLMRERNELYEVRLVYELQDETNKIERLKKELELFSMHEKDSHTLLDLYNVIGWIEEEQEKYKL